MHPEMGVQIVSQTYISSTMRTNVNRRMYKIEIKKKKQFTCRIVRMSLYRMDLFSVHIYDIRMLRMPEMLFTSFIFVVV